MEQIYTYFKIINQNGDIEREVNDNFKNSNPQFMKIVRDSVSKISAFEHFQRGGALDGQ